MFPSNMIFQSVFPAIHETTQTTTEFDLNMSFSEYDSNACLENSDFKLNKYIEN